MKNHRKIFTISALVFIALLFYSQTTFAAYITQTQTFSGTPNYSQTLTFNKYNETASLESVQVIFTLNISGGWLGVDNDGADPAVVTVELGASGSISSTDVILLNSAFQPVVTPLRVSTGSTFNLGGDDGDGPGNVDLNPPDGAVHIGGTLGGNDQGYINSMFFGGFTGDGTFDILALIDQILDFGGIGGVEGAFSPVTASGSVQIIYGNGAPVPEPSTFLLFGAGLIGLTGVIRRRIKK